MEQDLSQVLVTGDLNRGQSLSGDGNARTTDIVIVVRIRVRDLDWPERCCACPTRPADAKTT
jgi:hypothetical protein